MTSEAPAKEPENKDSVFGKGYMLFLGFVGGLFAVIAIAIPMVIIAGNLSESGGGSVAAPGETAPGETPATGNGETSAPVSGETVAADYGCVACHTTDGTATVGPSWLSLAGSDRSLESGETVVADDAYLRESIVDPAAKVVAGFAPIMPTTYGDDLTGDEIDALISYIDSLG